MDVGKKCLIMGILGAIIAIASSPFLTYMILTGKPIETLTHEKILKSYPYDFGPAFRIIDNRTVFPYKIMEFSTIPDLGEQYMLDKVLLNVETNGTIYVLISGKNSTFNNTLTFNSGNKTVELQVSSGDLYSLNVIGIVGNKTGVKCKVVVNWYHEVEGDSVVELDYLRTLGGIIGFPAGVILLVGAMVKLRKAVREARPETVERTAARRRYIEVEEEEE